MDNLMLLQKYRLDWVDQIAVKQIVCRDDLVL